MCLAIKDGGVRCHSHAKAELDRARKQLAENPTDSTLIEAVTVAEHQLELTATERKKLLAICDNPNTDPVEAVDARRKYDILTAEHQEQAGVSPFNARYGSYEEQTNAFKAEITAVYGSINNAERMQEVLNTMSNFHNYSAANQILIHAQAPNAVRVAGFKKWQSDFERTVKKGEKSIRIFAPAVRSVEEKDANGKPVMGADGKPVTRSKTTGFRLVPVFSDKQTEGKPLPQGHSLTEAPPEGFTQDLTAAIEQDGYTVVYEDTGFAGGWVDHNSKKVVVNIHASEASKAKTLAHELGHIKAGHVHRDDYHTGPGGCRGEMEMEAESLAYMLCRSNGMSTELTQTSAGYIQGWASTTDGKSVEDTMKEVSKTFKDIMTTGSWRNAQ